MKPSLHRAHHYGYLVERWRQLARSCGMRLHRFAQRGKYPLFCLRTPTLKHEGGIYATAGIHGDEPGATEGLLLWAETNAATLREIPLFLVPCLNPWGLVNNSRVDQDGHDLNRSFHRTEFAEIDALRKLAHPYQFALSMTLHEDFDGEGIYIYEVRRSPPFWGEALLKAARAVIPPDPRTRIDGRKAVKGLIRRRIDLKRFAEIGYPEAIWLHQKHSVRTFTVETPSEFALAQRAKAHAAVMDEAIRLLRKG